MHISLASLKHLKLPTSIKIPVTRTKCFYLHDSISTKFDFMNYASCRVVTQQLVRAKKTVEQVSFFVNN